MVTYQTRNGGQACCNYSEYCCIKQIYVMHVILRLSTTILLLDTPQKLTYLDFLVFKKNQSKHEKDYQLNIVDLRSISDDCIVNLHITYFLQGRVRLTLSLLFITGMMQLLQVRTKTCHGFTWACVQ